MAAARAAMTVGGGVRTARLLPRFCAVQKLRCPGGARSGGALSKRHAVRWGLRLGVDIRAGWGQRRGLFPFEILL